MNWTQRLAYAQKLQNMIKAGGKLYIYQIDIFRCSESAMFNWWTESMDGLPIQSHFDRMKQLRHYPMSAEIFSVKDETPAMKQTIQVWLENIEKLDTTESDTVETMTNLRVWLNWQLLLIEGGLLKYTLKTYQT